jgi:hypothetical protein
MPKRSPHSFLELLMIDADDHVGAREAQALDDVEADASQTEDDGRGALLDLGSIDDGADAGGDPAAHVADLVEGRGGRSWRAAISGKTV